MEINPRHPLIKELLRRVTDNPEDPKAKEIAVMMFRTATLRYVIFLKKKSHSYVYLKIYSLRRSGYMLQETADFAQTVEMMMRQTLGIPLDEQVDEEDFSISQEDDAADKYQQQDEDIDAEDHDEL